MHATQRGRAAYDLGGSVSASPQRSRLPPARNAAAERAALDAEPKWLEDAVLRIVRKHGLQMPVAEPPITLDLEDLQIVPARSRFVRVARAALVIALIAAAVFAVARWRYPAQTATYVARARGLGGQMGLTFARVRELTAHLPTFHSSPVSEPAVPAMPSPPKAAAAPGPVAASPVPVVAPPSVPAVPVSSLPAATAFAKAAPIDPPAPKAESRHHAHSVHASLPAAPLATPAAAPPAAPAAPPPAKIAEEPAPAPGSLADAIKRAGGGGKPAPVAERSVTPDPKPALDASLPERPSASMVTSALLGVLPDARACINDGDEARQAVVIFASNGSVGSVQVSGTNAACIQKALSRAHVAPFSQATYRATVPVRPN